MIKIRLMHTILIFLAIWTLAMAGTMAGDNEPAAVAVFYVQ